jgi:hypothetical protein
MPSTVAFAPTPEDLEDFPFDIPILTFARPREASNANAGLDISATPAQDEPNETAQGRPE